MPLFGFPLNSECTCAAGYDRLSAVFIKVQKREIIPLTSIKEFLTGLSGTFLKFFQLSICRRSLARIFRFLSLMVFCGTAIMADSSRSLLPL